MSAKMLVNHCHIKHHTKVTNDRQKEVKIKYGRLDQFSQAMDHNKNVEKWVEVVGPPKGIEHVSTRVLDCKDVDQKYETQQENASYASGSFEAPGVEFRQFVIAERGI